jgi:predicted kinase
MNKRNLEIFHRINEIFIENGVMRNNEPEHLELLLLIGASGSGKSRYTSNKDNYFVVSSDDVRMELFGTLTRQNDEDNELVFKEVHKSIEHLLNMGATIYDATNLSRKRRIHFYNHTLPKMVHSYRKDKFKGVKAIVFIEPFSVIKENNKKKPSEQQVPKYDLIKMYQTLQIPRIGVDCDDIEIHGETDFFNKKISYRDLLSVNSLKDLMEYVSKPYRDEMKKLFGPHDTPYHLESIEEHIDMCIKNAEGDEVLKLAAMFHDLGKAFTKKEGRYLNHQFLSSMYAMKAFSEISDMPDNVKRVVFEIIYQHMNGHDGLTKKIIRHYKLENDTVKYIHNFAKVDAESRMVGNV